MQISVRTGDLFVYASCTLSIAFLVLGWTWLFPLSMLMSSAFFSISIKKSIRKKVPFFQLGGRAFRDDYFKYFRRNIESVTIAYFSAAVVGIIYLARMETWNSPVAVGLVIAFLTIIIMVHIVSEL